MVLPLYHYGSFSRKIISWNISSRPNADLVIQTFQKAYHTRNCPAGLMFHSDRGSQYITFAFRKLLDELNVVQSFSKKAYPFDNACCESFFKYLKKEETNRRNFRTYRDLYHSVFQYIKDFYNSRRPHGSLGCNIRNILTIHFWIKNVIHIIEIQIPKIFFTPIHNKHIILFKADWKKIFPTQFPICFIQWLYS